VSRYSAAAERPSAAHPMATVDVHTHTVRSDGVLAPEVLVADAAAAGVRHLAITDHDSLAAYRELTASPAVSVLPAGISLIVGVEINALTSGFDVPDRELHILGYGMDPADTIFEAALAGQRALRRTRFFATIDRLREIGLPIDAQVAELDTSRDDALGRPTVARALVAAAFAESVEDAFIRLLGYGKPGYVPRGGLGPVEAIQAIRRAGGIPVLAHFAQALERLGMLRELVEVGLGGLEVFHSSFDDAARASVGSAARTLELVQTGGTDYHGDLGPYADALAELVIEPIVEEFARSMVRR
jgi:predicted metal-dependent phosphoesterase TrpH